MPHDSTGLLLALDQGTTNTKALLVDRQGQPVFHTSVPLELCTPGAGFVEQDANALWASARQVLTAAAERARTLGSKVEGIALSNQRETSIAWHRGTGQPLAAAVSWQCRRSATVCARLAGRADLIRKQTGLPLDPVLSATKWAWLLENSEAVQGAASEGELCLGTVDSWLVYKLTGGRVHATDTTNASRTGLLDLRTLRWSAELLGYFGIPAPALPSLCSSSGHLGACASIPELDGLPIVAAIGDSHAALAGHGAFMPGAIKATYGTGSSLMMLTPALVADTPQLARTVAWSLSGQPLGGQPTGGQSIAEHTQYALEGNIFMTGSAVQWAGEFLGLAEPTAAASALAGSVPDAAGAYFVPAMVGLGAPHWQAGARGLLCGLGRSHTAAHLARAAVESIAYQVADVFFAMRALAPASAAVLPALRADGGATRNRSLMQFQADLLGIPVLRSVNEELSAMGAAYLGGLALGWWPSLEAIAALERRVERIEPAMSQAEREQRYAGWQDALRRVILPRAEAA